MSKAVALGSPLSLRWVLSGSFARIAGSAMGFVATFIVTRELGPSAAGVLFATISWALALAILARWGASDRIMIELSPLRGGWREPVVAAFVNRETAHALVRSAILLTGVAVWHWLAGDDAPPLDLALLLALTPATVALQLVSAALKAMRLLTAAFFFELILQPLLVTGFMVMAILVEMPRTLDAIAASYLCATIAATAGCLLTAMRGQWHARRLRRGTLAGRRRAGNFALIEISNFLMMWLPTLMLPFLVSPAQVGTFNLALRMVAPIGLVSSTIFLLAVPSLASAHRHRDRAQWRATIRNSRIMMMIASALFLLGVLVAGPFVLRLAGDGFLAAQRPLALLATLFAGGVALGPSGAVLSVIGAEQLARNVNLAATGLALLAFGPAVRWGGVDAAALVGGGAFLAMKIGLLALEIRETGKLDWSGGTR